MYQQEKARVGYIDTLYNTHQTKNFRDEGFGHWKSGGRSLVHEKPGPVCPGSLCRKILISFHGLGSRMDISQIKGTNSLGRYIYEGVRIYRSGVLSHWYSISFFTSHKINLREIKLISSSIGLIQHAQIKRNTAPSACPISPYTTNKIPRLRENALILEVPSRIVDHDPRTALAR